MNVHFILLRVTLKNGLIIEAKNGYYFRELDSEYITIVEPAEYAYHPLKETTILASEIIVMAHTENSR